MARSVLSVQPSSSKMQVLIASRVSHSGTTSVEVTPFIAAHIITQVGVAGASTSSSMTSVLGALDPASVDPDDPDHDDDPDDPVDDDEPFDDDEPDHDDDPERGATHTSPLGLSM